MTRLYGRSINGTRCYDSVSHGEWEAVTMLSAIFSNAQTETIVFEGATNKVIFETYIEKFLLPHLKEGDILIMDNLSSHKSLKVKDLLDKKKVKLMFLPPYSPDLNPIEKMWSKIKAILRREKAQSYEALLDVIALAFSCISQSDTNGWFESCGYYS